MIVPCWYIEVPPPRMWGNLNFFGYITKGFNLRMFVIFNDRL